MNNIKNNITRLSRIFIFYSLVLIPITASAATREKQVINTLKGVNSTIGLNYSSGDYGTGVNNTILTIPFDIYYRSGNWNVGVSSSYLQTEGTGTILPNFGGPMGGGSGNQRPPGMGPGGSGSSGQTVTNSGFGDTIATANYIIPSWSTNTTNIYVTGKVKLPTADETKSLGTGEMDYAAELGFYKSNKGPDVYGSLGYQFTGEPAGTSLNDVLYGRIAISYQLQNNKSAGVSFYASESIYTSGDAPMEINGLFRALIDKNRWFNGYAGFGLTNGSPDWSAGFNIEFAF
ncbi:MAG: hypothetical protein ACC657_13600 [Thiohalomonadales bacterium]